MVARHGRGNATSLVLIAFAVVVLCLCSAPRSFVASTGRKSGGPQDQRLSPSASIPTEGCHTEQLGGSCQSDSWTDRLASWSSMLAAGMLIVSVMVGTPGASFAEEGKKSMAAVAPCLLSSCQLPLAKCIANPICAADLTCILGCTTAKDEASCQIKCGDNFENDVVVEFNACALSAKKCVPQRPPDKVLPTDAKWNPANGNYPEPPKGSVTQAFDTTKMSGRWFISAGLNPLFDDFDCQVHFFEGFTPDAKGKQIRDDLIKTGEAKKGPADYAGSGGRIIGKINWRINEADGEFLSKSTVQSFVQTEPGVLLNHGNEYLHYQDDWYILDADNMDDPEKGWVLVYYRGQNDAWANYGGGTLYTRARQTPGKFELGPEILDRVRAAAAKANVPFDKYWKFTDNSCKAEEDPVKLRAKYAAQILVQAELSAEEQLTILSRSTFAEVDKDEKFIVDSAARLGKQTQKFAKLDFDELKKEATKIAGKAEKNIERDQQIIEAPFINLVNWFKSIK